jgi:beta-glucanase (GH16 family)
MLPKIDAILIAGLSISWATPPTLPGFVLTWCDDFTSGNGSQPDPANWIFDIGTSYPGGPANWGTQEIQTYTDRPENVNISRHGVLQITPLRTGNNSWTSARIETQRTDFQAEAGRKMRISARIKMPDITGEAAAGYWPAFWTLGDNYRGNYQNWPGVGEFDIMEVCRSSQIFGTVLIMLERQWHQ